MWLLEFAKDRILGVDTRGQHVPSYVPYGTVCLLIRNIIGCASCSEEWELAWCFHLAHMVQEGPVRETLALQARPVGETVAKCDILI
jgi:hypothetical protein